MIISKETVMATMNVSLPDPMKAWVEEQIQTGKFGNASDYVRDLIRRDQEKRDAIQRLQKLIDEGFDSGMSERTVEEIVASAKARIFKRGI
jgi:antitoxin ParD1/3/4